MGEIESGADLDLGVWRNEIGITRIHDSSLQEFVVMVLAYAVSLFHFSLFNLDWHRCFVTCKLQRLVLPIPSFSYQIQMIACASIFFNLIWIFVPCDLAPKFQLPQHQHAHLAMPVSSLLFPPVSLFLISIINCENFLLKKKKNLWKFPT